MIPIVLPLSQKHSVLDNNRVVGTMGDLVVVPIPMENVVAMDIVYHKVDNVD